MHPEWTGGTNWLCMQFGVAPCTWRHMQKQSVCLGVQHAPGGDFLTALRILEARLVCEHAGGKERREKMNLFLEERKDDEDQ